MKDFAKSTSGRYLEVVVPTFAAGAVNPVLGVVVLIVALTLVLVVTGT